ncbi:hypothetical protein G6F59_016212 [Rhizopus arrhizus]|nr:hypothetical protein G6F59_016212 [Rhizopus arrhizus]
MAPAVALREPPGGVLPGQDRHGRSVVRVHVELQAGVAGFLQYGAHCTAAGFDLHQAQAPWRPEVRDHRVQPAALPAQHAGFAERVPALGQRDVVLLTAAGIHHVQAVAHLLGITQHAQFHRMHAWARARMPAT